MKIFTERNWYTKTRRGGIKNEKSNLLFLYHFAFKRIFIICGVFFYVWEHLPKINKVRSNRSNILILISTEGIFTFKIIYFY